MAFFGHSILSWSDKINVMLGYIYTTHLQLDVWMFPHLLLPYALLVGCQINICDYEKHS